MSATNSGLPFILVDVKDEIELESDALSGSSMLVLGGILVRLWYPHACWDQRSRHQSSTVWQAAVRGLEIVSALVEGGAALLLSSMWVRRGATDGLCPSRQLRNGSGSAKPATLLIGVIRSAHSMKS
jgi:hypothetical protein